MDIESIKESRISRGLTQQQFSRLCGINIRTLQRYEGSIIKNLRDITSRKIDNALRRYDDINNIN